MKEMIKKYRGSLISSILVILTEMSQTGAFYRLNSHNFVTKFSIFYICFLNCLLVSFKIEFYDFFIVYDIPLLKNVLNYKVVFF
jgi:hypothetical protein